MSHFLSKKEEENMTLMYHHSVLITPRHTERMELKLGIYYTLAQS